MLIYIIVLLIIVLTVMLMVRIGTVALRLTGLDAETASFQALSAFTGTGFTTSEADLITKHPGRRRTVKILIILGNAFFATIVAMIISFVVQWELAKDDRGTASEILLGLGALIAAFLLVLGFSWSTRFSRWLDHYIEKRIAKSHGYRTFQLQRVLDLAGGYTISEFRVHRDSWLIGRSLMDLSLGQYRILILAIERGLRLVHTPKADTAIEENDNIICYGPIDGMEVLVEGPDSPKVRRRSGGIPILAPRTADASGTNPADPPGTEPGTKKG